MLHAWFTYRRIFSTVLMMGVLAKGAATIQLNVELVVVSTCSVHVHAVRVVRVTFNWNYIIDKLSYDQWFSCFSILWTNLFKETHLVIFENNWRYQLYLQTNKQIFPNRQNSNNNRICKTMITYISSKFIQERVGIIYKRDNDQEGRGTCRCIACASCKERAMRYAPFKITEVDDSSMCWSRLGKRKILHLPLPSLRGRLSLRRASRRRSFHDNAVPLARQHRGSFERCGDDDCEHRVSSYVGEDVIARPSMRMLANTFAIPASHVQFSSLTYQPSRGDRWRNRWNRSWSSCSRPGIPPRYLQNFFDYVIWFFKHERD